MTRVVALRPEISALEGYHSVQVDAPVRLNTNESPYPPPDAWSHALAAAVTAGAHNRYPDRSAHSLRMALAEIHNVEPEEIYCANGSNEVLLNLLRAFGGPGRRALQFSPTYQLHSHIAQTTLTEVITAERRDDFSVDAEVAISVMVTTLPEITFFCSPNNPTGLAEDREVVERCVREAPGLVVVDEAYGQFSRWTALDLRRGSGSTSEERGLVVIKTFSKTWAMAGMRLGYLVADPDVVAGCEAVTLPYHLSAVTQEAGLLALRFADEMARRVAAIGEERGRIAAALSDLDLVQWPSDANFILFRPNAKEGREVWEDLVRRGVLVRDCSSWDGLTGCLRVTVGAPWENDRFLEAIKECV